MKQSYKGLPWSIAIFLAIGCSQVKFEKDPSFDRCQNSGEECVTLNGRDYFDKTVTLGIGQVDILFINDNSGSMSFEQKHMADRFSNFVSSLDSQGVDYRIGIITTDVSATVNNPPRAINQNGNLQDGRLISFSDGSKYLTPQTANKQTLFANAIKRPETLQCEAYWAGTKSGSELENCPSGDERGIYAAHLFVRDQAQSMLRSNAHFAMIFLSDEDVRSRLYEKYQSYSLASEDLPQNLINTIHQNFGGKTFSAHAIIAQPGALTGGRTASQAAEAIANKSATLTTLFSGGDNTCLNNQSQQMARATGSFGHLYALMARITGGIEGDICANDYGSQLSNIGSYISQRTNEIGIACDNPADLEITDLSSGTLFHDYDLTGRVIRVGSSVSSAREFRVTYSCQSL